jgi:leader peptidase (prepilin peptidase) / N-methyltransferase
LFLLFLNLITKGKGMGMGDVKLAIFVGLFLGWPRILVAMYAAFIVGAVVGVGLILGKKVKRKSQIPFGPFLILGTAIAYCCRIIL